MHLHDMDIVADNSDKYHIVFVMQDYVRNERR